VAQPEDPQEQTLSLPKFPPRPTDTAPLPVLPTALPGSAEPAQAAAQQYPVQQFQPGYAAPQPPHPSGPPAGGGPGRRGLSRRTVLALQALGLVAVAVISGVLWVNLRSSGGDEQPQDPGGSADHDAPAGKYEFTQKIQPVTVTECAKHSYPGNKPETVQKYLQQNPCQDMVRTLYTTTVPDGGQVVVTLAAVRMSSPEHAEKLKSIADIDGTGNVNDLLREGYRIPGGPDRLTKAGYAATVVDSTVVIVETDFFDPKRNSPEDGELLRDVANDALRLVHELG